jgi:iron complex transport system substrate-binding protein
MAATAPAIFRVRLLGQQDGIVGISGYVVRPPQSRREKPRVSAFTSANIDKILALKPDLVLTFLSISRLLRGDDLGIIDQRGKSSSEVRH